MLNQSQESMVNKLFIFCSIICVMSFFSCVNKEKSKKLRSIVTISQDNINITCLDKEAHTLRIILNNDTIQNTSFHDLWKSDIVDVLRKYKSYPDLALLATSSIGEPSIPLRIEVDENIDTLVSITIEPLSQKKANSSIVGPCAKLVLSSNNPNSLVELKKWLFRRHENIDEYRISKMLGIINRLKQKVENEYITNDEIPVMRNFSGKKYKINSEMKSDYYVLFAHSSDNEISGFIEDVVSHNFELTSKSLTSPMPCYRDLNSNGYKCISLIGINKDWTYQVEPLGLVCIDNITPSVNSDSNDFSYSDIIIKKINGIVILPKHINITGSLIINTQQFRGDNAQFVITWGGDIKQITVKREVRSSYSWLKPGKKTILLTNKTSPFHFSYELDLEIGDNYIPIEVMDIAGNISKYSLYIPMVSTKQDNPDINIDNNINVW